MSVKFTVRKEITVVIVNWNNKNLLSECLEGLKCQTYPHFSIIVVDNGSTDGSIEFLLQHHSDIHLIALPDNRGFAAANNLAIQNIDTDFFALLNNDAVPHPDWLKHLISALEDQPHAGSAASKMLFSHDPEQIDRTGDAYTLAGTGWLRGRGKSASCFQDRDWVFGACAGAALYRTKMFKDVGCFDEDFFLIYEDVDLNFRAQLKGYRCIYVPDAIVYHKSSASIGHDSPVSVYFSQRNLEWAYIKNMPATLFAITIVPHFLYTLGSAFFFGLTGHGITFLRAKMDAFRGLKKMLQKRLEIQKHRKTSTIYLFKLFEKELFFPRLFRRFRN